MKMRMVGFCAALAAGFGASPCSAHPETVQDRFFAAARTQDMATHCVYLDKSAATSARRAAMVRQLEQVTRAAKAKGYGHFAATGRQEWAAQRSGVDTSCIVGPQETDRSAYADLLSEFEHEIRLTAKALERLPRRVAKGH